MTYASQKKGTTIRVHPDTREQLDAIARMKRIRISQAVYLAVNAMYEELELSPAKIKHNANKR
jgi:predicted transcriptional regulator